MAAIFVVGCEQEIDRSAFSERQDPIVNGTAAPETVLLTAGQQLAIGYLHPAGLPINGNFCTGTIIAPTYVVTAEHCVDNSSASDIGFSVGADPTNPVATFGVTNIWVHPSEDAAILVLDQDATAVPTLEPIPANLEQIVASEIGTALQAGGYGDTYGTNVNGLWFATVYLADVYSDEILVDGRGLQGICYGDSGSGVVQDRGNGPVVLAVESWGDSSCVGIDHMTRLDNIQDWLVPILNGETPPDPCEGLDFLGECVDNVARWCSRGELRSRDCSSYGEGGQCVFFNNNIGYACACPDGLTYQGTCDRGIIQYCDDGLARSLNCNVRGLYCGWENNQAGYVCTTSPSCSPDDAAGRCDGNVRVQCTNGITEREDCAPSGDVCVLIAGEPTCIAPMMEAEETDMSDVSDMVAEPDMSVLDEMAPVPDMVAEAEPEEDTTPAMVVEPEPPAPDVALADHDGQISGGGCACTQTKSPATPVAPAFGLLAMVGVLVARRRRLRG